MENRNAFLLFSSLWDIRWKRRQDRPRTPRKNLRELAFRQEETLRNVNITGCRFEEEAIEELSCMQHPLLMIKEYANWMIDGTWFTPEECQETKQGSTDTIREPIEDCWNTTFPKRQGKWLRTLAMDNMGYNRGQRDQRGTPPETEPIRSRYVEQVLQEKQPTYSDSDDCDKPALEYEPEYEYRASLHQKPVPMVWKCEHQRFVRIRGEGQVTRECHSRRCMRTMLEWSRTEEGRRKMSSVEWGKFYYCMHAKCVRISGYDEAPLDVCSLPECNTEAFYWSHDNHCPELQRGERAEIWSPG
jgi:hypothetical protein